MTKCFGPETQNLGVLCFQVPNKRPLGTAHPSVFHQNGRKPHPSSNTSSSLLTGKEHKAS